MDTYNKRILQAAVSMIDETTVGAVVMTMTGQGVVNLQCNSDIAPLVFMARVLENWITNHMITADKMQFKANEGPEHG